MFSNRKPELKKDDEFQNEWFQPPPAPAAKKASPVQQHFEQVKAYAYGAFDKLDTNQNGFIETEELYAALQDENTSMRDKSYIMFLLTNQQEIAASAHEGDPEYLDGISRADLELYFRLAMSRVK